MKTAMANQEYIEKLLKEHDWSYSFSDDGRVWANGRKQEQVLFALLKAFAADHSEPEAVFLVAKHAPAGFGIAGIYVKPFKVKEEKQQR